MKEKYLTTCHNERPIEGFPVHISKSEKKEPGPIFDDHWHEQIQLLYFTQGKALICCNAKPIQVEPGDIVVINANELHYGEGLTNDLVYYVVRTDFSFLFSNQMDLCQTKYFTPLVQNLIVFKNKISGDKDLIRCMEKIINEFLYKDMGFELAIKAAMYDLIVILLRGCVEKNLSADEYHTQTLNLKRVQVALDYIETHYTESIGLTDLAAMVNTSIPHFCRIFKNITGKSSREYINQLRVNRAVGLLMKTDLNVTEIALEAGFNDINYFSRLFKKYKKIAPSQVRTKCRPDPLAIGISDSKI